MRTNDTNRLFRGELPWRIIAAGLLVVATLGCSRPDPGRPGPAAAAEPAQTAALPQQAVAPLEYVELITGGARTGDRLPLVIAVHGLGDSPRNFIDLYADVGAPARIVASRAPEPYGRGFTWFPIEIPYRDNAALAEGIGAAADRVAALIAHLGGTLEISGKPMITGFSQGGMVSFAVAVRHPDAVGFALPISGALPAALLPTGPQAAGRFPRIRALHGDVDDMVPIAPARDAVAQLGQLGIDVQLKEYAGVGHRITPAMSGELNRLISMYARRATSDAPNGGTSK